MINIISLLLLFTFSLNFDDVGEKLLKNLQDKFDNVNDISTDFKQSTNNKAELAESSYLKRRINLELSLKTLLLCPMVQQIGATIKKSIK